MYMYIALNFQPSSVADTGLKVNDQLAAYATSFSAVRLKNHVWSPHCGIKAKVQCNFFSAYSLNRINDSD